VLVELDGGAQTSEAGAHDEGSDMVWQSGATCADLGHADDSTKR
jgi:hypothetical protein